jgi:glycosyltransferase involved in cell wall biosynthesis
VALFLGRLSPEKGLDQLIPAWRQVIRHDPQALLLLAGPDHQGYRASVEASVEREALRDHVLMPGMLQGREKLLALSRADLYVQPSYSEGFSLSVLEALACAKPCVITTGCNFPAVGASGAGEVVAPQADALSAALLGMLALSPQARQEMGLRGQSLVAQKYTWDSVARQMLVVYRCLLENRPVPPYPEPATPTTEI